MKGWATTRTTVPLSSGEVEFYGLANGACEGLGLVGLLEDITRRRATIEIDIDSSAVKGIATRRGVGKVKHFEPRTQDQMGGGRMEVKKINGDVNTADILTKYFPGKRLGDIMQMMPGKIEFGRLAVRLHGDGGGA